MKSNKYLDDISEIKNMMSRSSRFISLSGLSGILAGIYSLIGFVIAQSRIKIYLEPKEVLESTQPIAINTAQLSIELFTIAIVVIIMATITGILLSIRKAKQSDEKIWDVSSKRLAVNFLIPLVTGGIFCIALLQENHVGLVAPVTLIFYGLACVNASKYTLGDVRYLGYANILIGLIATQFTGYGLYFWALGFGVFHIFYGTRMYLKFDIKKI
ncbi:hypothetical protein DHD05_07825 [Arenibacter sp. N53]|uniref:hypothetical protein n=1 Tax=Arenibacter TaxID=178469 RepID=UPI000CD428E7|nr:MULTISPECIES: hypothetical protein [Arenibacter]MCM4151494.1 hypothetical protein [Arenibacter sp. N53]